ncbi:MAG: cysteine desulfurase-like protein [Planctomycetaceae bacterium]|nr:cysteine desulfurase-like protein [Planctomycetaceae bacterium]
MSFDLSIVRSRFPALGRVMGDRPVVFFDGPAGSQVPRRVIDAVSGYLSSCNANQGGAFATSRETDAVVEGAQRAVCDLLGAADPDEIVFGANMTSLTFAFSRALSRTWSAGDEILVSRLDHDANVTPWVLAARDAGATVRQIEIDPTDCTLNMDDFRSKLSAKTKLVAVGYASNAVGTINPVREIIEAAQEVGALTFVDAVHYAPHGLIDVAALQCDFLVCSAYKFFGPHVGILWGRKSLLESLDAYKVRPAPTSPPGKWMTGTQNHEGIAGTAAAIDYLAELGAAERDEASSNRRAALVSAFAAIREYEQQLVSHLLGGLNDISDIRIYGITDPDQLHERVPTVSFTHTRFAPSAIAAKLAERGIFVWAGNHYALPFTEAMGLEPDGTVRVGLLHYNTEEEVDRLLEQLCTLD